MRCILAIVLFLGGCSQQPAEPSIAPGNFAGQGKDRLCIAGEAGGLRGGLIAYGEGNNNCSASGRIEVDQKGNLTLVPRGEGPCRVQLTVKDDVVRVAEWPTACTYYCGPGASISGRSFTRSTTALPATDFAGDQLC